MITAQAALFEGVSVLAPMFLTMPSAFSGLMRQLCQGYLKTCEALEQEPDGELLGPIVAVFDTLDEEEADA